jgi:hypothetical protein
MDISAILFSKYPDAQWNLNGEKYEGLEWVSNSPKPTQEELESLWDEVQSLKQVELEAKIAQKSVILERIGLTEEELKVVLS